MAAITQLGTALKIAYGTNVLTGYIMESFDTSASGEQVVVKNEDNATVTVLVCDLGTKKEFTAIIKNSGGSLTPPAQGSSVTINLIKYRCESSSVKQSRLASMLTISVIKEDSMTYS